MSGFCFILAGSLRGETRLRIRNWAEEVCLANAASLCLILEGSPLAVMHYILADVQTF